MWNVYRYDIHARGVVGKYGWQRGYTIEIEETAIISSICVELRWIDRLDFHGLIFSWNWTDKMHMNVDIPELNFSQSSSGYKEVDIVALREIPNGFVIEAKNEKEVVEKLKEMEMNKIHCNIDLSITPKPRFFDKGNQFTLLIDCCYYIPEISD